MQPTDQELNHFMQHMMIKKEDHAFSSTKSLTQANERFFTAAQICALYE